MYEVSERIFSSDFSTGFLHHWIHTSCCFPGLPLFFLPLISGSSISLMLILKLTASVAPDSLDESLKKKGQENTLKSLFRYL